MKTRLPRFLVSLEPRFRWWREIRVLCASDWPSTLGNQDWFFHDHLKLRYQPLGRSIGVSILLHFVLAVFAVRMQFVFITPASSGEPVERPADRVVYYNLRTLQLTQLLSNVATRGKGGKPDRGIRPENPPRLGSSAPHPKMTIVLSSPHPDNNRQTILQSSSPPDLRISEELPVPALLMENPLSPQRPRFEFRATAGGGKPTKSENMDDPATPRMPLVLPEFTVTAFPAGISEPHLPVPPISLPIAPAKRTGAAEGNAGPNGNAGAPGGILVISVDPANGAQLALPAGNRWGSFTISPAGAEPGSPGGVPGGDPEGGYRGPGSGGDGSSGVGPGRNGGAGGGAGSNGVLSIAGGRTGPIGVSVGTLPKGSSPESLIYALPAVLRPRHTPLVVSAGPIGGGGLRVYGVLHGGKIYTIYLDMPGGAWVLQYCEVQNPISQPTPASQSRMIQLGQPLVPPAPQEKFDFHRLAAPQSKKNALIVLHGMIREDGGVGQLSVLQGVGSEMEQAAVIAFSRWKFIPAFRGGKPAAVEVLVGIPVNRVEAK